MSERIDVISTHLDDAALSVGAWVHARTRRGAHVRIITVLAGDPVSQTPAGNWDAKAGFKTQGEAAIARRVEDVAACRILGAEPVWFAFSDEQYERPETDDLKEALTQALSGADRILIPGYPLAHPDHRRIAPIALLSAPSKARTTFYLEQPYARDLPSGANAWSIEQQDTIDIKAKRDACRAYHSQLRLLGRVPVVHRIRRFESKAGGESFLHTRTHSLLND